MKDSIFEGALGGVNAVENSVKGGMDMVKEKIGPVEFPTIEMGEIGRRPRLGKAGLA